MTADLPQRLRRRIRDEGPLRLDIFMAAAVDDYYGRGTAFGREGDFITAPEISQVFGEIVGLWSAVVWQSMGMPSPVRLVELGPGRGTLMADLLRAVKQVPAFAAAIDLHFIERSPALRRSQKEAVAPRPATWHDDLDSLPDGPSIFVANEFLDALPIRQWELTADGWHERCVGLAEDGETFRFVAGPAVPEDEIQALTADMEDVDVGAVVEFSPAVQSVGRTTAERLKDQGGAALFFDYGYAQSAPGDTLQALRRHTHVHPLEAPGQDDLTAHVDFSRFAAAARSAGAAVHGPTTQGRFLAALGAEQRARSLIAKAASPQQATEISSGVRRLIHPEEMGTLFKAIALTDPALPVPPGFEGRRNKD